MKRNKVKENGRIYYYKCKEWRDLERTGIKDRVAIINLNDYLQDAEKRY